MLPLLGIGIEAEDSAVTAHDPDITIGSDRHSVIISIDWRGNFDPLSVDQADLCSCRTDSPTVICRQGDAVDYFMSEMVDMVPARPIIMDECALISYGPAIRG